MVRIGTFQLWRLHQFLYINTSPKTNETSVYAHRNACTNYPHITVQCIYCVATIPTSDKYVLVKTSKDKVDNKSVKLTLLRLMQVPKSSLRNFEGHVLSTSCHFCLDKLCSRCSNQPLSATLEHHISKSLMSLIVCVT